MTGENTLFLPTEWKGATAGTANVWLLKVAKKIHFVQIHKMCFSEGLTYIFASEKLRRRGISRFCILIVESVCNATRGVTEKLSNFLFVFIASPGDEL